MRLIWHPLALDDLSQVTQYCRHNFGIHIAKKVKDRYQNDVSLLKNHPLLGFIDPFLIDFGTLEYRSLVVENTKIIYTAHTDYIYIHLIWDCRRQPESLRTEISKRVSHI